MDRVIVAGSEITLGQIVNVARQGANVTLSPLAQKNIRLSRGVVNKLVEDSKVVYGVTTGFGMFSETFIEKEFTNSLQKNLIVSHAVGAGDFFKDEVVCAAMLLRINDFAKGYSGIRPETVETLIRMLNEGVTPLVPEKGSLGASGDLVPLAHMVLPLLGLGQARYKGEVMDGKAAMDAAGIPTQELTQKEGLALINGTQFMTAVGALAVYDAIQLLKVADIAAAMSFEAQNGIIDALDARMHAIRPHKGQIDTARIVSDLLKGSKNVTRQGEKRVQDAYSLRCTPQVHGASKDAVHYVQDKVEIETNSVTDNPIVFTETEEAISGGNFHGQPMALSFDFPGIALAEIADIAERRIERMVNSALSGLPSFLVERGGVNSGYMIVQYTAAALVSENKVLAHPASVDSIPSSANQEDHVSMGTIAARQGARDLGKCAARARHRAHVRLPGDRPARRQGPGAWHGSGVPLRAQRGAFPHRGQAGARRNGGNGQRDHRHHAQRLNGFRGGQVRSSLFFAKILLFPCIMFPNVLQYYSQGFNFRGEHGRRSMKTAGFSKSWIVFFCFLITLLCFVLAVTTRVRVSEKKEYYSAEQVALYLYAYKRLPSNFLSEQEAEEEFGSVSLCLAAGYNIGGGEFSAEQREDYRDWIGNYSGKTSFFECDIYPDRAQSISQGGRGDVRLVYSSDYTEVYFTDNHYGQYEIPGFVFYSRFSLNGLSNSFWIAFGVVCFAQAAFVLEAYLSRRRRPALWEGLCEAVEHFVWFCFELVIIPVCLVAYPVQILYLKYKKRKKEKKENKTKE